jgi:hypothetical protein
MIEYLMGWIQMDQLQKHMVKHAFSTPKNNILKTVFNESPEYIANTEREFTLKAPIHAVEFPRKGPQAHEYTIGASWNNIISTDALWVYATNTYYILPPL